MGTVRFEQSVIHQSCYMMVSSHPVPGMASFRYQTIMLRRVRSSMPPFKCLVLTEGSVVVDHHEYQVFTNELVALQPWQHRQLVCNNEPSYSSGVDKWVVVGEWTAAETDCAPALNGYGIGARYDGTYPGSSYVGSCDGISNIANWDDDMKGNVRGYIEAQLSTFESHTQGWVFWNFKTESAHEWDAFMLLDYGIFPQPLTDLEFGAICSS
jgi:glucan 1,3-beta-glucosidase